MFKGISGQAQYGSMPYILEFHIYAEMTDE